MVPASPEFCQAYAMDKSCLTEEVFYTIDDGDFKKCYLIIVLEIAFFKISVCYIGLTRINLFKSIINLFKHFPYGEFIRAPSFTSSAFYAILGSFG